MNSNHFQPGDVVSVRFGGVLRHYGVVTFGGRVVSNNGRLGGVVSQTCEEFARGRPIRHHGSSNPDDAYKVTHRAHRRIGYDYDLTGSNCVHHVRTARGQSPTLTQYVRATAITLGDMFRRP